MSSCTPVGAGQRSLADLLSDIAQSQLTPTIRDEICACVEFSAAALGRDLEDMTTDPAHWRMRISELMRLSSRSGSTADLVGEEWGRHMRRLMKPSRLSVLRPFAKFCIARGIAITDVDEEVLKRYVSWLVKGEKVRWPRQTGVDVSRAWNRQIGDDPEWPCARLAISVGGGRS